MSQNNESKAGANYYNKISDTLTDGFDVLGVDAKERVKSIVSDIPHGKDIEKIVAPHRAIADRTFREQYSLCKKALQKYTDEQNSDEHKVKI